MGNQLVYDSEQAIGLLSENDGAAVEVINASGSAPIVFVCEHASARIPEKLKNLGLDETSRTSHIAWDPGSRDVAIGLSEAFDAPLVMSRISRLVYDCNRPAHVPGAYLEKSENIEIPGNKGLSDADKTLRVDEVYTPFRQSLGQVIAEKSRHYPKPIIVTLHSFTPVYFGNWREVELGILHDSDERMADAMLDTAIGLTKLKVRRNEPYGPADGVTHTLKIHGNSNGLMNVMIEISNELLKTPDGIAGMVATLKTMIERSLTSLHGDNG